MAGLNVKQKISLIVFGIGILLLGLEIFLCVSNLLSTQFFLPHYDFSDIEEGTYVIFCLGDSFTYGTGAGFEYGYPAQLEKLLNRKANGRKFRVFNLGVPGYDSRKIAARFKKFLRCYTPDMVIVMAGANDAWNFKDMSGNEKKWCEWKFFSVVCAGRIGKFFSILSYNMLNAVKGNSLRQKTDATVRTKESEKLLDEGNTLRAQNLFKEAESCYRKFLSVNPRDSLALLELGRCYRLAGECDQAIAVLSLAFKINPCEAQVRAELEAVLIENKDAMKSAEIYSRMAEEMPDNEYLNKQLSQTYAFSGGQCFLYNRLDAAETFYRRAAVAYPKRKRDFLEMVRDISVFRNTLKGVDEIVRLCRSKGKTTILFSGYPRFVPLATCFAARRYGIALVEHDFLFKDAQRLHPERVYFVSKTDPHCTRLGYGIMAQHIAEAVLEIVDSATSRKPRSSGRDKEELPGVNPEHSPPVVAGNVEWVKDD